MDTQFKVKLTPKEDKTVFSHNLPDMIQRKEDLNPKLAPMHEFGILMVLPFSRNANPNIAHGKLNKKLRLLVAVRKIKTLIAED